MYLFIQSFALIILSSKLHESRNYSGFCNFIYLYLVPSIKVSRFEKFNNNFIPKLYKFLMIKSDDFHQLWEYDNFFPYFLLGEHVQPLPSGPNIAIDLISSVKLSNNKAKRYKIIVWLHWSLNSLTSVAPQFTNSSALDGKVLLRPRDASSSSFILLVGSV